MCMHGPDVLSISVAAAVASAQGPSIQALAMAATQSGATGDDLVWVTLVQMHHTSLPRWKGNIASHQT